MALSLLDYSILLSVIFYPWQITQVLLRVYPTVEVNNFSDANGNET
ncbi:MAG TPA: hypothetical protein VKZ95_08960 [Sphingobacteriaceae bacterium]|nr:hypothetical protein [Sphingobacteriaceae bacterium]